MTPKITALILFIVLTNTAAQATDLENLPLLQSSDLVYQGSFSFPGNPSGNDNTSYEYAARGIAYSGHESIYAFGHVNKFIIGEIGIPTLRTGPAITDLALAPVKQTLRLVPWNVNAIGQDGNRIMSGLLVWKDKLVATAVLTYDAGHNQQLSHFTSNLDFTNAKGPFAVGTRTAELDSAGYVAGYMGVIPPVWREALGGPVITGQTGMVSIIGRTSLSAAAFVFNPDDLGVKTPVPAIPLAYTSECCHPYLGKWHSNLGDIVPETGQPGIINAITGFSGVVFPEGTRSILFFGSQGKGHFCYGHGTTDPAMEGQPVPGAPGNWYCWDPINPQKGQHGYPYKTIVHAYDALDLMAVKNGQKQPWEVKPYAIWDQKYPFAPGGIDEVQTTYDPATGRIFVSLGHMHAGHLLMHVYTIKKAVTPVPTPVPIDKTAPTVPKNLVASVISANQINLSWSASKDNVAVEGYRIFRNGVLIASQVQTSYSNMGLNPSTTYLYTVQALDTAGNVSAKSSSVITKTGVLVDTKSPTVPTGLSVTVVSSSQINLSWSFSIDNVGVAGYTVYRNGVPIANTTATSYSNTGLVPSTNYFYTVSAFDAAGNKSNPSSSVIVKTR